MTSITIGELVGGLIFGSIGFVAFVYGKRRALWAPMLTGLALMAYPYFVPGTVALYSIGIALSVSLLISR